MPPPPVLLPHTHHVMTIIRNDEGGRRTEPNPKQTIFVETAGASTILESNIERELFHVVHVDFLLGRRREIRTLLLCDDPGSQRYVRKNAYIRTILRSTKYPCAPYASENAYHHISSSYDSRFTFG